MKLHMIKKCTAMIVTLGLFLTCISVTDVFAAKKTRHEYYFSTYSENPNGGWYAKKTNLSVKIKKKKIVVKGNAYLTHKLDSGTDTNVKKLKYKKRTYKLNKKTKFYSLHWSTATKISRKQALSSIKHKSDFQVYFRGKKIIKLFVLNHGA